VSDGRSKLSINPDSDDTIVEKERISFFPHLDVPVRGLLGERNRRKENRKQEKNFHEADGLREQSRSPAPWQATQTWPGR
jgi:hypothetical protein